MVVVSCGSGGLVVTHVCLTVMSRNKFSISHHNGNFIFQEFVYYESINREVNKRLIVDSRSDV